MRQRDAGDVASNPDQGADNETGRLAHRDNDLEKADDGHRAALHGVADQEHDLRGELDHHRNKKLDLKRSQDAC